MFCEDSGWFRDGSAMAPEPLPSEGHAFCEGSGWFHDGSTMVPRWFRDGFVLVPRWFRSRSRRITICLVKGRAGSTMVPIWFREHDGRELRQKSAALQTDSERLVCALDKRG